MTYNPDNPDEGFEQHGRTQGARTCAWKDHCRCTHTNCWDGFLDEEITVRNHEFDYLTVRRCPQCAKAREISIEVAAQKNRRRAS